MARQLLLTAFICILAIASTKAQIREVPKEVEQAFTTQYTGAEDIDYKDHLLNVRVHFTQKGEKMIATYTNKGMWKETEKDWTFEQLSDSIKDGFQKSKYAEWKVTETKVLYKPNNIEQYRIKIEKSDIQKKYLLFNANGRLLQEDLTL